MPDQIEIITVEELSEISTIEISPVLELNQVAVSTISEIENINVGLVDPISYIEIENDPQEFVVQVSQVDMTSMVQSVNGKTGHVVIDYPDINQDPVNHVKYVHTQVGISDTWNITHNLGFFPNVTVLDNANRIIEADVQYVNVNSVKIVMNVAISGVAYLT